MKMRFLDEFRTTVSRTIVRNISKMFEQDLLGIQAWKP